MTDKTLTPPAPVSRPPDALSFNDDDLYLINVVTGKCIRRIESRRDHPGTYHTFTVPLGHAAMYGMQAKHFVKG